MKKLVYITATAALLASGAAAQQSDGTNAATGMVGGAATGAILGGPVGAGVGAVVGATLGGALTPPPAEVVTYVQQQPAPPSVVVQQPVAVGKPIPETVVLTPVPENPTYAYAVVNERRVIVEPKSRTVVQVVN
ncbi:DUF1236 domain-containing protein [Sinorhizobium medicae]|uniref:DUF1236 domain-containing protein n=2 Tax=Sinorhizobium medicae TaxID=110321 RepID=A0A508WSP4_9HYPH|nr:DUF1236 domain-containing protein [Sinorhizobium medicae]ABR60276.1 protein of unknown function DUF1236 [Sinorhizobium medicae WSM419]MBO1940289.1 DUF1236 domain-containing protein [Sinorhizobium medicae]MBO1962442.1 DUF1236 domain-containing protein [Sinorhizobium medicae]MDX0408530.1 DUF1236 domain-containing protein [Sinorhizobium medicae]MDX0414164.1 DUF1236 domain-containing protein [Sinorhizobium medicae]